MNEGGRERKYWGKNERKWESDRRRESVYFLCFFVRTSSLSLFLTLVF